MKRLLPLSLVLVLSVFSAGCELLLIGGGIAAGAGAVAYVAGETKSLEDVEFEKARKATDKALTQLGYEIEQRDVSYEKVKAQPSDDESQNDLLGLGEDILATATFTARDADDTKVVVKLQKLSETQTRLNVRIGTFGDETQSRKILDQIRKNL
ncbi:DUF3568 domain-containing protein [bacterium]|nr:DUF3568 domain-containing protein [bacterium]